MSDIRLAPNIYQTPTGFRVFVRELDPRTGKSHKVGKRFGPGFTLAQLEAYRDARIEAGKDPDLIPSFAVDAARYLAHPQVAAAPAFKTRQIEIAKWVDVFGDTPREEIDTARVDAELQHLKSAGYANATVNKFRTALMHVWTRLDGRGAANPVRDAQMFEEARMTPRGQSYALLTKILDAVNDEPGVAFDRATLYREVWTEPATVVAKRYDVSSTFLARICRKLVIPTPPRGHWAKPVEQRPARPALSKSEVRGTTPELFKARARLEVLAWTGMDPSQLMRMNPVEDLDLFQRWYQPPFRRKGARRRRSPRPVIRLPLVPDAVLAFQRLIEVDGWGAFDVRSLNKAWQRACRRVERTLRAELGNPRFRVPHIRLKDLRHSFGTKVYEDTGNLQTVAQLLQHAPGSPMTIRYSLGAVPDVLRSQLATFSGGRSRGESPEVVPGGGTKTVPFPQKR